MYIVLCMDSKKWKALVFPWVSALSLSHVACHISLFHMTYVTCHMSHVTCHMSHIGCNVPGVRVLEGISLPRGRCFQFVLPINVLPLGPLVHSHLDSGLTESWQLEDGFRKQHPPLLLHSKFIITLKTLHCPLNSQLHYAPYVELCPLHSQPSVPCHQPLESLQPK